MHVNITCEDGVLVCRDLFNTVKFKSTRVVVNDVVELKPFRDKILVKTGTSHYLEKTVTLCVWYIDEFADRVELRTYNCRKQSIHFNGDLYD